MASSSIDVSQVIDGSDRDVIEMSSIEENDEIDEIEKLREHPQNLNELIYFNILLSFLFVPRPQLAAAALQPHRSAAIRIPPEGKLQ